jgi:hypothetical protein
MTGGACILTREMHKYLETENLEEKAYLGCK